jgi:hypothetical protein
MWMSLPFTWVLVSWLGLLHSAISTLLQQFLCLCLLNNVKHKCVFTWKDGELLMKLLNLLDYYISDIGLLPLVKTNR